jgi:hypothetical protein
MSIDRWILTFLTMPSIAVRMSCLYKCTQKSASSSSAKFRRIPHPAVLVSRLESVRVCSSKIRTICSRSSSFLHFESSIMLVIALAAADLLLISTLCKSARMGKMRFSRRAASSGSAGGLADLEVGSDLFLFRFLGFDFPIVLVLVFRFLGLVKAEMEEKRIGPPGKVSEWQNSEIIIHRLLILACPRAAGFRGPVVPDAEIRPFF